MTLAHLLIAHAVKVLALVALAGILVTRKTHLCWSFVAYLFAVLVCNSLVSFWPERFWVQPFWMFQTALFDLLKIAITAELTLRALQAFPHARIVARRYLIILLSMTAFALVGIPALSDYGTFMTQWEPRVLTGTIWLMIALALVITWYRIPVHAYHKAILLGFVPYLLIFTVALNLTKDRGWSFLPYLQALDPGAYLLLMAFWAWSAWREQEQEGISPAVARMLQPLGA